MAAASHSFYPAPTGDDPSVFTPYSAPAGQSWQDTVSATYGSNASGIIKSLSGVDANFNWGSFASDLANRSAQGDPTLGFTNSGRSSSDTLTAQILQAAGPQFQATAAPFAQAGQTFDSNTTTREAAASDSGGFLGGSMTPLLIALAAIAGPEVLGADGITGAMATPASAFAAGGDAGFEAFADRFAAPIAGASAFTGDLPLDPNAGAPGTSPITGGSGVPDWAQGLSSAATNITADFSNLFGPQVTGDLIPGTSFTGTQLVDAFGQVGEGSAFGPAGAAASSPWSSIQDYLKKLKGPLGTVGTGLNIFSAIKGLGLAGDMKNLSATAMDPSKTVFDPFGNPAQAGARAPYQAQLQQLLADPSQVFNDPSYKAGEQAVMRTQAAGGYLGSGNMMLAMRDFGGNFYNSAVSRLANLSGANINPTNLGTLPAAINAGAASADLTGRSLATLGKTAMDLGNV